MKALKLHTAAVDNGGARRDAGDVLIVGDKPSQISADRASDLVGKSAAVAHGATAPAKKKPSTKKAAKPKGSRRAPTPAPAPAPTPPAADATDGQ